MNLYEFQAKQIFRNEGISVPRGEPASSPEEVEKIAQDLGGSVVIKTQVLVGGRGLAGGIKFADNPSQARQVAETLFGIDLKGHRVHKLLVEEKVDIAHEYYLSVLVDQEKKQPLIMLSPAGGVDIEEVAEKTPEKIHKRHGDIFRGLNDFSTRSLAKSAGIDPKKTRAFTKVIKQLYALFEKYDAELVEINPLVLTTKGDFMAVDAKFTIDSKASFRHRKLAEESAALEVQPDSGTELRKFQAKELGLSAYFELDGYIGIITDGAGTGMLTFDLVNDFGGKPANFCELGGETSPDLMKSSLDIVTANPTVKVVLVNLIGGLNRMDEMAEGIVMFAQAKKVDIPIVIRMTGTRAEEGRAMLTEAGIESSEDLYKCVENAVSAARR